MLSACRIGGFYQRKCVDHLLNLIVTTDSIDKIEELTALFTKCKKIIGFLKFKGAEVTAKQVELRDLLENIPDDVLNAGHDYFADAPAPPTTSLKSDNDTRWNSKYKMLHSIYVNRDVIRSILMEHEK